MTCLEVGIGHADRQSVGAPAAIIVEPILSTAGVIDLPEGYLTRLRSVCDERGMKLIVDEAQTAFGRLGYSFGFERDGIVPDAVAVSKTLGGGLPLAATIVSDEIEQTCFERGFVYVTSHLSDPLPAEVGLAVLRVVARERLGAAALSKGAYLKQRCIELQQKHECIGDVRGRGLLLGMEIVKDRESKDPDSDLGARIMNRCFELGLNMNIVRSKAQGSVFRMAPPLTVTNEEIDLGVEILDKAINDSVSLTR